MLAVAQETEFTVVSRHETRCCHDMNDSMATCLNVRGARFFDAIPTRSRLPHCLGSELRRTQGILVWERKKRTSTVEKHANTGGLFTDDNGISLVIHV